MDFLFILLFRTLHQLVLWLQPFLVPLCFICAWTIVAMSLWTLWSAVREGLDRARAMHRIPCSNCKYFTQNYYLKCPVHPTDALSEAAIGCADFEATQWEMPTVK
ncbi:MAG: hypothetical protein AAGF66_02575 [Cyanobacteria bacterium P01_H01_bin.119]|mgnify:CR=1